MKMKGIKLTYIVDSPNMSDEEFEDQPEREYVLTESQIKKILEDHIPLSKGERIDWNNSWINGI